MIGEGDIAVRTRLGVAAIYTFNEWCEPTPVLQEDDAFPAIEPLFDLGSEGCGDRQLLEIS